MVARSVARLVARLVQRLVSRSVARLVARTVARLATRLVTVSRGKEMPVVDGGDAEFYPLSGGCGQLQWFSMN